MIRPFLPALGAALALASCAAQPALAQSYNGGQLPNGLTYRGAMAGSDVIVCQPNGSPTAKGCLASDVAAYVTTSVTAFGAKGDGVTDDTAAWQAALNSGQPLTCQGIYKISATLVQSTISLNSGQKIVGAGANQKGQGAGNTGSDIANRCTIVPTSAVSVAWLIDGGSTSNILSNVSISNIAIDMTNMAAGSAAWKLGQVIGAHLTDLSTINDASKYGILATTGAELVQVDSFSGYDISCITAGTDNPTTVAMVNPNIAQFQMDGCANVTTVGGAIQPVYQAGSTTVQYIPAGSTLTLLNFSPTTAAMASTYGYTDGGIYVALGSYVARAQQLEMLGTDVEEATALPTSGHSDGHGGGCTASLGTWTGGTYTDGTHGCQPMVYVFQVEPTVSNCNIDDPIFFQVYLQTAYEYTNGCNVRGLYVNATNSSQSFIETPLNTSAINVWNNQFIKFYTDAGVTQTGLIDGSDGLLAFAGATFKPLSNGQMFTLENASGQAYMLCVAQATIGSSYCSVGDGADWRGFSDAGFSTQTYDLDANTGNATFTGVVKSPSMLAQPATDGDQVLVVKKASGTFLLDAYTGGGAGVLNFYNQMSAVGYSDTGSTLAWSLSVPGSGSGLLTLDGAGSTTITLTGSTGAISATGSILDTGAGGIGYGTGAGGTVTQGTSRTTGVTLNKAAGAIMLFSAAGSSTPASFTLTDSAIAATDTVNLSVKSATNTYAAVVTAVAAGSCQITVWSLSGTATDAPVINFGVLKGATS